MILGSTQSGCQGYGICLAEGMLLCHLDKNPVTHSVCTHSHTTHRLVSPVLLSYTTGLNMQQHAASPDMLDCAVQAAHQEAVANLQAQIAAAQEETEAKQAIVLERETTVAELESRLSELQEKAAGSETAIGPSSAPLYCTVPLLVTNLKSALTVRRGHALFTTWDRCPLDTNRFC